MRFMRPDIELNLAETPHKGELHEKRHEVFDHKTD
jgi:hypothetical protein